jgi:hypothetical protein
MIMRTEISQLSKTFVVNGELIDTAKSLLGSGWLKKSETIFVRERNTYTIELDSSHHPMWNVIVTVKNPQEFDENDWKLRQDLGKLRGLGSKQVEKKLYLGDTNKDEIGRMVQALKKNQFNLIYDNNYLIIRSRPNAIKVFKLAAALELVEQPDGWYVGQRKIL